MQTNILFGNLCKKLKVKIDVKTKNRCKKPARRNKNNVFD